MTKKYNKIKGDRGETIAAQYLTQKGHLLLSKNYRIRTGEIDLISQDDDTIVFTEVKYRSTVKYGTPGQAVDYRKQQHIIRVALYYMQHNHLYDYNVRFDVIEVLKEVEGLCVNHIENAFTMNI